MKISEWGILYTDEQVDKFITQFLSRPFLVEYPYNSNETFELYKKITGSENINNRSKLFYLEQFEDLIIKGRITTIKDIIKYKDSLF